MLRYSALCPIQFGGKLLESIRSVKGRYKKRQRDTVWHNEACRVMTNGDLQIILGAHFQSHTYTNNRFFFLHTIDCYFEDPEYAEMHYNPMTSLDDARLRSGKIRISDPG